MIKERRRGMTNEKKVGEMFPFYEDMDDVEIVQTVFKRAGAIEMAKWKDEQIMELWNVVRNVHEAWMGGTMNDVGECMRDLGHVYDKFKDKGIY